MSSEVDETKKPNPVNYAKVAQALTCSCVPYQDTMTYKQWTANNMQVQKGQKAIRIPGLPLIFCRCQVQPKDSGKTYNISKEN
jgi:hypothetical protein